MVEIKTVLEDCRFFEESPSSSGVDFDFFLFELFAGVSVTLS